MTDNNELHLEKINWDNMDAIIRLQVTKEQRMRFPEQELSEMRRLGEHPQDCRR